MTTTSTVVLLPFPAVFIDAKRNGGKLLKDSHGFLYNVKQRRDATSYWYCRSKKDYFCSVTVVVKDDMVYSMRGNWLFTFFIITFPSFFLVCQTIPLNIPPQSNQWIPFLQVSTTMTATWLKGW